MRTFICGYVLGVISVAAILMLLARGAQVGDIIDE